MEKTHKAMDRFTRRAWFARTAAALGAAAVWPVGRVASAADGKSALIVQSRRPLDLETPVSALDFWLTPNDGFFVRSHFGEPAVGLPWTTDVLGLVSKSLVLSLDDFKTFEQRTVTAVLQCSGNGRANFRPTIPGVGWKRGAVGQAEWSGVRLADVLEKTGVKDGAAHVHLIGADGPPSPKTPAFLRSIPLSKALHPDTLLATRMNGAPLPVLHGGPVRLIVPGWTGNHWMKWLRALTVSKDEAPGFFMQTGYRLPKVPAPPGAILKPSDLMPLTTMNVKSLITEPSEGAALRPGKLEVRGMAWTGEGHAEKIEVSVGAGAATRWREAEWIDLARPWSWRRWRFQIERAVPGRLVLGARATDSRGQTQPETTPYNKGGYFWNGIDHVTCEVS